MTKLGPVAKTINEENVDAYSGQIELKCLLVLEHSACLGSHVLLFLVERPESTDHSHIS